MFDRNKFNELLIVLVTFFEMCSKCDIYVAVQGRGFDVVNVTYTSRYRVRDRWSKCDIYATVQGKRIDVVNVKYTSRFRVG